MPSDSLIQQIRERLDYESLFGEFLRLTGRGAERTAFCIFHENTNTPALSVNVEEGLYICRNPACGARGDVFTFYQRVRSLNFPETVRELARRVGLEVDDTPGSETGTIDEGVVDAAHHRLIHTPSYLDFLEQRRGLRRETIDRWKLGHDGQRYYIPIRDEIGRLVNIRRYKPNASRAQDKMISWRAGYGGARLWPFDSVARARNEGVTLYVFEGEMDALLGLQYGLAAMTATGGAGTWREDWGPIFRGVDVVICYDNDDAGHRGSTNVAMHLHSLARRVRIVQIPLAEPPGADFTDYIVGHGHSIEDFRVLAEQAQPFAPVQVDPSADDEDREPYDLHLSQASEARYHNEPIRVKVVVSGKATAPYLTPQTVQMSCSMPGLPMCERCPVARHAGSVRHTMNYESNEILQFINVPDSQVQKQLKAKVGVPPRCGYVEMEVVESMNVEEIHLIPEIDRSEAERQYVTRVAFYTGHGLQTNRSYVMTGVTVPDPKRQLATHLINTAVPAQSNIDAFRLVPEIVDDLRAFQPTRSGVDGLWERLDSVYDDLERHTRIYQRRDLMLAVDLTYHSVLAFDLQEERLVRGWVETLVIGDSRTGKTTLVQRMMDYYGAGEFSAGENTSLAGLVGGLHQIGTSWTLQWGKVPLNDRRLLVIDEAGNLPTEQIGRMSSMRSSGVAEVIKVHTERTHSRTRQIWISNPRGMRPLSSYSQGVLAVKELIGAPEDIARFDLVVTAASGDVELAVINAQRGRQEPQRYTSNLCHQRVMWAWSRTGEQVRWAEGAEQYLLDVATRHGQRYQYATEIPLVEPNEQRVKLARLAVSTAAMFFSTGEPEGTTILVRPEHVQFASQFLERLYQKPSLAFDDFAEGKRRMHELSDPEAVARIVARSPDAAQQLMEQEQFTQRDLSEILAFDDRAEMRTAVSVLRGAGFLQRYGTTFYYKTPAAINWLRRRLSSTNGNGTYAGVSSFEADLADDEPDF